MRKSSKDRDLLEIDPILSRAQGGKDELKNFQLLHRHCRDVKSANEGG
ncbi:MAG: HNH endonuclease [Leptolyngbyaceae cyanobacterium HOT.MB2.61]|nr:HNH endonuclease [Leptolyngbyaceae cyanobacterium HOT.MB2.61]